MVLLSWVHFENILRMGSCVLLNVLSIDESWNRDYLYSEISVLKLVCGKRFLIFTYITKVIASSFIKLSHLDCSLYVSFTTEVSFETSGRSEIAGKRRHSCSCFLRKTRPASAVL